MAVLGEMSQDGEWNRPGNETIEITTKLNTNSIHVNNAQAPEGQTTEGAAFFAYFFSL